MANLYARDATMISDLDDDAWTDAQRKRSVVSAMLYPWVREHHDVRYAYTKHRLGWAGRMWGGPAVRVSDEPPPGEEGKDPDLTTLYSTGKMVEMVLVASHEPDVFEELVDEHTLEELRSMLMNLIIRRAAERAEED